MLKSKLILLFFFFSSLAFSQVDSVQLELPYAFPMVIRYENNQATINHINRIRLQNLAEYMIKTPSFQIVIEGHVCCHPNKHISKKRAKTVYRYLRKLDVPTSQMKFVGKSFDEPIIAKEKNEVDKNINRRVVIKILK